MAGDPRAIQHRARPRSPHREGDAQLDPRRRRPSTTKSTKPPRPPHLPRFPPQTAARTKAASAAFRLPADLSEKDGGDPAESYWLGAREYSDGDWSNSPRKSSSKSASAAPSSRWRSSSAAASATMTRRGAVPCSKRSTTPASTPRSPTMPMPASRSPATLIGTYKYRNPAAGTGSSAIKAGPGYLSQADLLTDARQCRCAPLRHLSRSAPTAKPAMPPTSARPSLSTKRWSSACRKLHRSQGQDRDHRGRHARAMRTEGLRPPFPESCLSAGSTQGNLKTASFRKPMRSIFFSFPFLAATAFAQEGQTGGVPLPCLRREG